jgi:hypothetical protein
MQLAEHRNGIDMTLIEVRLIGIPLPRVVLPRIAATERAQGVRHHFDVSIALPIIGRLVRYQGWLEDTESSTVWREQARPVNI